MEPVIRLGIFLISLYIIALKVFAGLDIRGVFEHRLLLPLLNTLFAGIVPIVVAYVANKAHTQPLGGFDRRILVKGIVK